MKQQKRIWLILLIIIIGMASFYGCGIRKVTEEKPAVATIATETKPIEKEESVEGEETIVAYEVKNGEVDFKSEDVSTADAKKYKEMWDAARSLIPRDMMEKINTYRVMTDGPDETLAYVEQDEKDYSKWVIALDRKDSITDDGDINKEFSDTVIHEIAHIFSLEEGQMDRKAEGTYRVEEGNLREDAYLNLFYQEFWSSINENPSEEEAYEYYMAHPDQFVDDYAATNPAEDFAETFMVFVRDEKPTGNEIKDQKVRFMYDHPKLVEYRNFMRKNLQGKRADALFFLVFFKT